MSQDPLRSATSRAVTRLSQLLLSRKLKDVRDVDGTSVEDQERAELRIPHLLKVPAVVHFLSCEPLLGPLNLEARLNNVQWVISGGESGPKHRPVDVDWIRELNAECAAAGVAHFFKQQGGRTHAQGGRLLDGVEIKHFPPTHAALAA